MPCNGEVIVWSLCLEVSPRYVVSVSRDGSVSWSGVIHVSLKCDQDVRKFPFDAQTCGMKWPLVQSMRQAPVLYYLTNGNISNGLGKTAENSEWDLERYYVQDDTFVLEMKRIPTKVLDCHIQSDGSSLCLSVRPSVGHAFFSNR